MPDPLTVAVPDAIPGGFLVALAVALPVAVAALAPWLGARRAQAATLLLVPVGIAVAVAVAAVAYIIGEPPIQRLGTITLRADGATAAILVTTALVVGAVAFSARAEFGVPGVGRNGGVALAFWTLLPALWAGANGMLLANDLFSLYVAQEVLTLASVPLVCLDGRAETLSAALRNLLFALLGSALYLLGAALLYGAYGTLDIASLSRVARADAPTLVAAGLMTAGLLAKTALFPLHLWLPPAHGAAASAASALLSAVVVTAHFVLLVRLWFSALPGLLSPSVAQLLAALGAAAILLGSVMALRQARLKVLLAYSTVGQVGYLMLMLPLVVAAGDTAAGASAWLGGVLQAVSHALAKAGMYLAAGLMAQAVGHDRVEALGTAGRAVPVAVVAFGLGGLSLMGIPPSGGFSAKWLLLAVALETRQWWWALVIVVGGLLTGAYVYRVIAGAVIAGGHTPSATRPPGVGRREGLALALVLGSVTLGLLPLGSFGLVQIGRFDPISRAVVP